MPQISFAKILTLSFTFHIVSFEFRSAFLGANGIPVLGLKLQAVQSAGEGNKRNHRMGESFFFSCKIEQNKTLLVKVVSNKEPS